MKARLTAKAEKTSSSSWGIVESSFLEKRMPDNETIKVLRSPQTSENSHECIAQKHAMATTHDMEIWKTTEEELRISLKNEGCKQRYWRAGRSAEACPFNCKLQTISFPPSLLVRGSARSLALKHSATWFTVSETIDFSKKSRAISKSTCEQDDENSVMFRWELIQKWVSFEEWPVGKGAPTTLASIMFLCGFWHPCGCASNASKIPVIKDEISAGRWKIRKKAGSWDGQKKG